MLLKILVLLAIVVAIIIGWKLLTVDRPVPGSRRRRSRGAGSEPEAVDLVACAGCGAWKPAGADCQSCGRTSG